MTIDIINQTISTMCLEVKTHASKLQNWQLMTEDELLYEVAICIFSSQTMFEVAVAMADHLREQKLLKPALFSQNVQVIEQKIVMALSNSLPIIFCSGAQRWVRPRFKNRLALLLAMTISEIYGQSRTLRDFLLNACDANKARKTLIQHVWGFGPKQASLFLRRVGYCANLAVLDVHILDYLRLVRGLLLSPHKLGRLEFYEEIEGIFQEIAGEFGHSVGCVDLAVWLTMRVAKREAFL